MKFKFEIKIKKIYLSKHILFDQKQSFKKISFQVSMNLIYIKQLFLLKRIFCWLTVFVMFVCRYQYYSGKKKKKSGKTTCTRQERRNENTARYNL